MILRSRIKLEGVLGEGELLGFASHEVLERGAVPTKDEKLHFLHKN